MVRQKAFTSRILIILMTFIFVFFLPIRVCASPVDPEDYIIYSGVLKFNGVDDYLYLHSSADVSSAQENSKVATFSGKQLEYMSFEQIEGYTYNGQAYYRVDYTIENMPSGVIPSYPTFYLTDVNTPDNITVTAQIVTRDSTSIGINYIVSFSNYIASYTGTASYSYLANFDYYVSLNDTQLGNTVGYSDLRMGRDPEVDWHGYLYEYIQLEDAPGYEGTTINQNQTIINQSETQIQNQQQQIQQQEQANQLQQESNEQNKNFMDNFFSNLGNTVLSWIVPSSEQITDFFNEVNVWFSERLGFVWYPFDLAIQLVTALAGGAADTGFTVPAFSLNFQGQQLNIWNSFEVDIDAFGIFQYVRFFTSTLLVCGIVKMAIDKWDEWIGGHNQ